MSMPDRVLPKPKWAEVENIIGYTFEEPLTVAMVDDMKARTRYALKGGAWRWESKPSVYYRGGHATLQHDRLNNLGWTESAGWNWLYFGNLPGKQAKTIHQHDQEGREKFADEVMKKYGSYCWSDRNRREWNLKGNPAKRWVPNDYDKPDAALLEVWVRPDKTLHGHCSRNRFRWVGDETLKTSLHALAVEWINMLDSRASDLTFGRLPPAPPRGAAKHDTRRVSKAP